MGDFFADHTTIAWVVIVVLVVVGLGLAARIFDKGTDRRTGGTDLGAAGTALFVWICFGMCAFGIFVATQRDDIRAAELRREQHVRDLRSNVVRLCGEQAGARFDAIAPGWNPPRGGKPGPDGAHDVIIAECG